MDGQNVVAPEPPYTVSLHAIVAKYRQKIDEEVYQRLLAEAAVDELIAKNNRLIAELKEVQAAKEEQEAQFKEELEGVRSQLEELQSSSE